MTLVPTDFINDVLPELFRPITIIPRISLPKLISLGIYSEIELVLSIMGCLNFVQLIKLWSDLIMFGLQ